MAESTLILDIDEVLCLGRPEACLELLQSFERGDTPSKQCLSMLFSPVARNALAVTHRRAGGARYVISSSWREHFSREQMVLILNGGGLQFVANNLHQGDAWRCPPKRVHREREAEILHWLSTHHRGEPFAVLDDRWSAGMLLFSHQNPDSRLFGRVVICTPGIGLTMDHVDFLVDALGRPDIHTGTAMDEP